MPEQYQSDDSDPWASQGPSLPQGMKVPGNLDPWDRQVLQNPDGSYSTTSSVSIGTSDGETLIPTVVDGKRLSLPDAIAHYKATGQHFGVFDSPESADSYAEDLHNKQAAARDQHGALRPWGFDPPKNALVGLAQPPEVYGPNLPYDVMEHPSAWPGHIVENLAKGTYNTLAGLVQTPDEVLQGKYKLSELPEVGRKYAADLALSGGAIPAPPGSLRSISGYHGSPHEFEPEPGAPLGRFRDSAIGSGEGAQAYGYGHYVAESPGVAKSYIPGENREFFNYDGKKLHRDEIGDIEDPVEHTGVSELVHQGFDKDRAVKALQDDLAKTPSPMSSPEQLTKLSKQRMAEDPPPGYIDEEMRHQAEQEALYRKHTDAVIDWIKANHQRLGPTDESGALYKVEVKPDKEELLDWDKPLREQSPGVKEKLQSFAAAHGYGDLSSFENTRAGQGASFYKAISNDLGGDAAVSKALHEAGVPGIKFLDQQSRSQNYVVRATNPHEFNADPQFGVFKNNPGSTIPYEKPVKDGFTTRKEAETHAESLKTHNLVIFDPSNIKVIARNGKAIQPVEHDPFEEPRRPVDHTPEFASESHPRIPGAHRAPNGRFYVLDPERPGKYLEVPE